MTIVDYYDGMGEIIKDSGNPDVFKISPSSIQDFFIATPQYYREQVEGEERTFKGSTSTHLGTIVHHVAETTAFDPTAQVSAAEVAAYLTAIVDPEVDIEKISELWPTMSSVLITNTTQNPDWDIIASEDFKFKKLNDDVYIGGTYDCLRKDPAVNDGVCVVDYKTAATKPQGISQKYRLQAYAYAWMLRESGVKVTSIELCFVTRPTKTLPVRFFDFKEFYTDENHEYIGKILNLIAKSVSAYKHGDTELKQLLAQDFNITEKTASVAFPL